MIITPTFLLRASQQEPHTHNNLKGVRSTLRTLTARVNELMGVTFHHKDEYVVLLCVDHVTRDLALELQDKFQEQRPLQAMMVSYGQITTSKDGYIVIRWCGSVPEAFFDKLDADEDVFFYIAFSAAPLDTCITPWHARSNA